LKGPFGCAKINVEADISEMAVRLRLHRELCAAGYCALVHAGVR